MNPIRFGILVLVASGFAAAQPENSALPRRRGFAGAPRRIIEVL